MSKTVIVLGAGIVGVGVVVRLRRRGLDVVLVDRQGPGEGASFGNSRLIQREKVFPIGFSRPMAQLQRSYATLARYLRRLRDVQRPDGPGMRVMTKPFAMDVLAARVQRMTSA